MQRWCDDHADVCMKNKTHMGFAVPTSSVNVVYQLCHLFSHYFDEGIGLRQLMDYYFALRVWHNDVMECMDLQSQCMWSEGLGTPVLSKEEVFKEIWEMESVGDIATVTVHIKKIREKIEKSTAKPQYIETIWGVGYRFKV